MNSGLEIRGLYAITGPERNSGLTLEADVAAAIRGGARLVQYRDKTASGDQRLARATRLLDVCSQGGASLIINDDAQLACETGAAGVHIGASDGDLRAVRQRIGSGRIVGVSCYDDLTRALEAQSAGADYVAFGSVYPSPTKPLAPAASRELLITARRQLHIPIVAIGGITLDNAEHVISTGIDAIAVISALFGAADVEATANRFTSLFDRIEQV